MARWRFAAFMILIACLAASCSGHRQAGHPGNRGPISAGTGDVAFRLVWTGTSDLDLYVQDPAGNCVFFANRKSDTGAILDIDCNGGTDQICEVPVENVYWPARTAPAGTYTYWVQANSMVLTEGPVPFELQLLRGDRIVWRRTGSIRAQEERFGPFAYPFSTNQAATPVETGVQPPCSFYATIREGWEQN
jgi:hypothetical protein